MDKEFIQPFVNGVRNVLKKIASVDVKTTEEPFEENSEIKSKGVTSIISYSGKICGRFLIDMEANTAISLTRRITGKIFNTANEALVLSTVSELNNIIAGDGLTDINNKFSMGLKLVPPIVFTGENALICLDRIPSESVNIGTEYGEIRINIAFERSPEVSG